MNTNNMKILPAQNKTLHSLLYQTGMMPQKRNLVIGFTDGRTEHSSEMLATEADQLIKYLKDHDTPAQASNKMRRKIISMCHRLRWTVEPGKVDMERLNNWCIEKSYLKKPLKDYAYNELPKLVSQFTELYKYYLNSVF